MNCSCRIVLDFGDPTTAQQILDSVKQENGDWIKAERVEGRLVCEAGSETIGGLLHTAEDFLSCIALAEKMIRK